MNVLVIGSDGQLGREVRNVSSKWSDRYFFADLSETCGEDTIRLDVTDIDAVRRVVQENDIDIIVNCAAYTDVERAEDNPAQCELLNADAPRGLAEIMKEADGLLFHISTDYVFDGSQIIPYTEDVEPSPLSVYGRTKLNGEKAVEASGCKYIIIRTSWLYSEYGRNFVKTMLRLFSERSQINVVSDQKGTPTYALDLAEVICSIIGNGQYHGKYGIYNYSNAGECSWYEFAEEISRIDGNDSCGISPCTTDDYPVKAARPLYSVLDKSKIVDTFGVEVPYWKDSLQKCLANLKTF